MSCLERPRRSPLVWAFVAALLCPSACSKSSKPKHDRQKERDCAALRVAFVGDSGTGSDARAVLELIKDQGAELVVHQGDLGYGDARGWISMVDDVLGRDFPYIFSTGNHDVQSDSDWSELYAPFLRQRIAGNENLTCDAPDEHLKRLSCRFRNLHVVLTDGAQGTARDGVEVARFFSQELAKGDSDWQVCSWHVPAPVLSLVENATSGMSLEPYKACARHGAIVATAHVHNYSRTKTLTGFSPLTASTASGQRLEVATGSDGGQTFAFVSGLGGNGIDELSCQPPSPSCPLWASGFDDAYGALLIDFGCGDDSKRARGRFVAVDRGVVDEFVIVSAQ